MWKLSKEIISTPVKISFVDCCLASAILVLFLILALPGFPRAQGNAPSKPLYKLDLDKVSVVVPCPVWCIPERNTSPCTADDALNVKVRITPGSDAGDSSDLWYEFLPEIGVLEQNGSNMTWKLAAASDGVYSLRVRINRGFETVEVLTKSVELLACNCTCAVTCNDFDVSANKKSVEEGGTVSIRAIQKGVFASPGSIQAQSFEWRVENGSW